MYRVTLTCTAIVAFIVAYLYRRQIAKLLGIEDTNVIHFTLQDIYNAGWRSSEFHFQVCVWKILCTTPTDKKIPKDKPMGSKKSPSEHVSSWFSEKFPLLGDSSSRSSAPDNHSDPYDVEAEENSKLPAVGKKCSIYVRLAL